MTLLAYIPFLEPLPGVHGWWWALLVPIALGVSMSWKSVRVVSLDRYWPEVIAMTIQIIVALIAIAAGLFVLIQLVLPHLPAE